MDSDNPWMVVFTYTVVILPWSVLPFWDPLGPHWSPFKRVRFRTCAYLAITFCPYALLIPYAILQLCGKERDIKEFVTACVAALVSIWNMLRAVRGVYALLDVSGMWNAVDTGLWAHKDIDGKKEKKISCRNVQVAHWLVDNDWPGEAARVFYWDYYRPYSYDWMCKMESPWSLLWKLAGTDSDEGNIRGLPAYILDKRKRFCAIGLWTLWMITNPYSLNIVDDILLRHFKAPDWWNSMFPGYIESDEKFALDSGFVARALSNVNANTENLYPFKRQGATKDKDKSNVQTSPKVHNNEVLPHINERQEIPNIDAFWFEDIVSVSKTELEDWMSKLPHPAQNSLQWVTEEKLHIWGIHIAMNMEDIKMPAHRICAALGLPDICTYMIQEWLECKVEKATPTLNEITLTPLNERGIAMAIIAILQVHRRPGDRPRIVNKEVLTRKLEYLIRIIEFLLLIEEVAGSNREEGKEKGIEKSDKKGGPIQKNRSHTNAQYDLLQSLRMDKGYVQSRELQRVVMGNEKSVLYCPDFFKALRSLKNILQSRVEDMPKELNDSNIVRHGLTMFHLYERKDETEMAVLISETWGEGLRQAIQRVLGTCVQASESESQVISV